MSSRNSSKLRDKEDKFYSTYRVKHPFELPFGSNSKEDDKIGQLNKEMIDAYIISNSNDIKSQNEASDSKKVAALKTMLDSYRN